jgi:hypothetical protein
MCNANVVWNRIGFPGFMSDTPLTTTPTIARYPQRAADCQQRLHRARGRFKHRFGTFRETQMTRSNLFATTSPGAAPYLA